MGSSFLSMNEYYFCNKEKIQILQKTLRKEKVKRLHFQAQQLTVYLQMKSSFQQGFWKNNKINVAVNN